MKEGKKKQSTEEQTVKDYMSIFKDNSSVVIETEWTSKGDTFQKFSMYEKYTPVKTSGSTTFINK